MSEGEKQEARHVRGSQKNLNK